MQTLLNTEVIAVLQSLSDAAIIVDGRGRIAFANDRAERLLGYEPATLAKPLIRRLLPAAIELRWNLGDSIWPVRLDESQLDQVVFNLVANARDAMPAGGTLSVMTRNVSCDGDLFLAGGGLMPGDYVQLSFIDTGVGMDAATIAHVFEPFYTTKPPGEGTGLGLASVYGIVKQHHGEIHIESATGEGTRVVIHFPRCGATGADT